MELQPKFQVGDTVQIFKRHTNGENWHNLMDQCIGFIFQIENRVYAKKYKTFVYGCNFKEDFWNIHEESLTLVVSGVSNTNGCISEDTTEISTPCKT